MLSALITFVLLILQCVSSLDPISGNFLSKPSGKIQLISRLLKNQLTCDFDELNFCAFENNGGWSFQRSLLDLVKRLTKTAQSVLTSTEGNRTGTVPPELRAPTPPNHYVCADWGVSTPSARRTTSTNLTARLESYVLVPVLRNRRWIDVSPSTDQTAPDVKAVPSGGRVLYVGPADSSPFHPKLAESRPVTEDRGIQAEDQDDCACLQMNILLPESKTAKLTVRFGSISQSVALPGLEGAWRPDQRKVSTTATTTTSMFASLVAGIIWPFAAGSVQSVRSNSANRQPPQPPANQWLHLRLPITTRLFPTSFGITTTEVTSPPPTPTAFSLHGVSGVCLDDVALTATRSADCPRSLTWTTASSDNSSATEVLFFNDHGQPFRPPPPSSSLSPSQRQQQPSGPIGNRVAGVNEATGHVYGSTPGRQSLWEHFLNSTFLFGMLLALLIIFVIVGLAVAVACGKRASRHAVDSLRKKKTTFLRETTVLRSPSVCSMPTFTVAPMGLQRRSAERTRDELCYRHSVSVDSTICSSSVENGLLIDEDCRLPPFQLSAEESSLLEPQNQAMVNKRRPTRRSAPSSTAHQPYLLQSKPAVEPAKLRRPKSSFGSNPHLPSNPQPGARLSLLLSINEDSELVLVPQAFNHPEEPLSSTDNTIETHPDTLPSEIPTSTNSLDTHPTTAVLSGQPRSVCHSSHLSAAETEATLAEMAASVGALGVAPALSPSPCAPKEVEEEETVSVDSCIFEAETLPMYREAIQLLDQLVDGATNPLSLSPPAAATLDKSDKQN